MEGDNREVRRKNRMKNVRKKIQTRQKKGWSHCQCLSSSLAYNLTSLRNLINQSIILSSPVCYLEMKSRLKRESVCMPVRPLSFLSPSNQPPTSSVHDTAKNAKCLKRFASSPVYSSFLFCFLHCSSLQSTQTSILHPATEKKSRLSSLRSFTMLYSIYSHLHLLYCKSKCLDMFCMCAGPLHCVCTRGYNRCEYLCMHERLSVWHTWSCIMKIPRSCLDFPVVIGCNWLNGYFMMIYDYTCCLYSHALVCVCVNVCLLCIYMQI